MSSPIDTRGQRLFFALWPEPALASALAAQVPARVLPQFRIAAAELHITLLFLGYISERQHKAAVEVAETVRVPPFDLMLDRVGQFARAQVVWLGPQHIPEPLHQLVDTLRVGLDAVLPPGEIEDEYRPHVTLARRTFLVPPPRDCTPQLWKVKEFMLMSSTSHETQGSRFTRLERWPLQA